MNRPLRQPGRTSDEHSPTVDSGLGENRLQVVLHSVLRHEQALGEFACVAALDEVSEQLCLPLAQAGNSAIQRGALDGGRRFDADGDRGGIDR